MTFRRNEVVWIPKLDASSITNAPIYMVNHETFYPVVLKGDFMHESEPTNPGEMVNTIFVAVDLTYCYVCDNRRANAVITTGTAD